MDSMIADLAERMFSEQVTQQMRGKAACGAWQAALWQTIQEAGLPLAMVPEAAGGFGVAMEEALDIMRISGAHGLPVPLAESMMANWLAGQAGLPVSVAPQTVADGANLALDKTGDGWVVSGGLNAVPWGRNSERIVTTLTYAGKNFVVALPTTELAFQTAENLAGEPRDTTEFKLDLGKDQIAETALPADCLHLMGALMRSLSMAGALETVLEMCVSYANDRVQFGRPIGKFQAIQQYLATMAGEVAAARAAADMGADAFNVAPSPHLVAAAKLRTGEASQTVAALAHQVHGAIGFTEEYALQHFTKRLWSWRDEFGTERDWSRTLGKAALAGSSGSFWNFVTGTSGNGEVA
ncbi:acyl-CoA dehydrogenase family protein [Profundibacter sp.]